MGTTEKAILARLNTGIKGLDNLLYGGIPERNQVLVIGDVGSGKTLLSFEIAYRNALNDIPTTFLTTEEDRTALLNFINSTFSGLTAIRGIVGGNKLHVEEKKLQFAMRNQEGIQASVVDIIKTAEQNGSKLLVIDSFSHLRALHDNDRSFTRDLDFIMESIRSQNVTGIITFETTEKATPDKMIPGLFDESMFDGIIRLTRKASDNELTYQLSVIKMRYSRFKSTTCDFAITPSGIVVTPSIP